LHQELTSRIDREVISFGINLEEICQLHVHNQVAYLDLESENYQLLLTLTVLHLFESEKDIKKMIPINIRFFTSKGRVVTFSRFMNLNQH